MKHFFLAGVLAGIGISLSAETLTWVGAGEQAGEWNLDGANRVWQNEAGENVAWTNGAIAVFPKSDAAIEIQVGEGVIADGIDATASLIFSGAPLELASGTVNPRIWHIDFEGGILAPHGLHFKGSKLSFDHYLQKGTDQIVFENIHLSTISKVGGSTEGGWINAHDLTPCHWKYFPESETASVQLQCYDDKYIKGFVVLLSQKENNIAAQIENSYFYQTSDKSLVGKIDLVKDKATPGKVAEGLYQEGYGISSFWICPEENLTAGVTLGGKCRIDGSIRIAQNSTLCLSRQAVLNGLTITNSIVNDGTFLFRSERPHTFTGSMSGLGRLEVDIPAEELHIPSAYTGYVGNSDHETRFHDISIEEISSMTGTMGGMLFHQLDNYDTRTFHFTVDLDKKEAYGQMQFAEINPDPSIHSYLKCVKIKLVQDGHDIVATPVYARYITINPAEPRWGRDFDKSYDEDFEPVTGGEHTHGYGIQNFGLVIRSAWNFKTETANTYRGGTTIRSGYVPIYTPKSIPGNSSIPANLVIGPQATVRMICQNAGNEGRPGIIDPSDSILVQGHLSLERDWTIGGGKGLIIDGGTVDIRSGWGNTGNHYLNMLTLSNGGKLTGRMYNVGYYYFRENPPSFTKVVGNTPITNSVSMRLIRNAGAENEPNSQFYVFDIEDVTTNREPDYVAAAPILDIEGHKGLSAGLRVVKKGQGTLLLAAANTTTSQLDVVEGTLAFGNTEALKKNPILLSNASLEVQADGVQAGTLTVTNGIETAQILLGEKGQEGSISFADSSKAEWNGDLQIIGDLRPGMIRFGTTSQALTEPQLGRIRCICKKDAAPQKVMLNAAGWLTLTPKGTLLLLQ